MIAARALLLCATAFTLNSCGYHVSGHPDLLPSNIKTIAVPAFGNATSRYRLSEMMPRALTREFISRTRYRVVADVNEADAVLQGAVVNYIFYPTVLDPVSGRAAGIQASVILQLSLVDRTTGKVLFTRPSMEVRNRYEIAADPKVYFEESDLALQRISQDVARAVVSAVLENF